MGFYIINELIGRRFICEGYVEKIQEDTIGWRHHIREVNYINGDLLPEYRLAIDAWVEWDKLGKFISKLK
jgi:hypothetical protein